MPQQPLTCRRQRSTRPSRPTPPEDPRPACHTGTRAEPEHRYGNLTLVRCMVPFWTTVAYASNRQGLPVLAGLNIGIVCAPAFGRYRHGFGFSDRKSGLGGSELLLLDTSEAFASRGAVVTVFLGDRHDARAIGNGELKFRPFWEAAAWAGDTVVVFRFGVERARLPRGSRYIGWVTDAPSTEAPISTLHLVTAVDHIVALSPYHLGLYERFMDDCGLPDRARPPSSIITPGIRASELVSSEKNPNRAIFCSVPEQGLDVLLQAWPMVRAVRPSASLVVTSDYTLWGLSGQAETWRARFAPDQGVIVTGAVPRSRLLRMQAASVLHLHPALVPENFCIASLECQAAGTPTITSNVGAMTTTVLDGITGECVPAEPQESFVERYVERVLTIWGTPELLSAMAERSRARVRERFDYARVSSHWACLLSDQERSN